MPAGSELSLCYGPKSNRYLLKWYGFAMVDNKYDSLTFHMPADVDSPLLYRSFAKLADRQKHGHMFRSKLHRVNILLMAECRRRLLKRQVKDTSLRWFATDLKFELEAIYEYRSFFEDFLKNHCRSENEFNDKFELWRNNKISYGKYAALLCEHSYFKIANKHVKYSILMEKLVNGLIEKQNRKSLKQLYMTKYDDIAFPGESHIEVILGMARYLQQLYHCLPASE